MHVRVCRRVLNSPEMKGERTRRGECVARFAEHSILGFLSERKTNHRHLLVCAPVRCAKFHFFTPLQQPV